MLKIPERFGGYIMSDFFFYISQPPIVGLDLPIVEISRSHSDTTFGRTPLDEWSARRRDLYLTTTITHKRQDITLLVGFETAVPANERSQTNALDRAAKGIYPTQNKYSFFDFSETSGSYQQVYFHYSRTQGVDIALVWWNSGGINLCSCVVSVALIR